MLRIVCIFIFVLCVALWVNNIVNDVVRTMLATMNPFDENKIDEDEGKMFMYLRTVLAFMIAISLTGILCL